MAAPKKTAPKPAAKPPVLQALSVEPVEVVLAGPRAERQLLVTGRFSDGVERDLTGYVRYFPTSPKTVRVAGSGLVTGDGDGEGRVKVAAGKLSAWVRVVVKDAGASVPVSFSNDVLPILTKAGCNQGACHGAQHGKGGLKLSLLGYDPDADYPTLAREMEGRRIVRTEPGQSLLLRKATLAVPHAGGLRFKPDSYEYRVLVSWVQDGTPGPVAGEPEVTSVEVQPAQRTVKLGSIAPGQPVTVAIPQPKGAPKLLKLPQTQRLVVVARFKDGRTEDVTRKAQFNTLNEGVVGAGMDGAAEIAGKGAGAVMVRYRGQATVARFTVPYRDLPAFPKVARASFIDDLVAAKWRQMGLLPSARCTDAEFIRRVYLDVLGILPTPDEVRAFLAECAAERQEEMGKRGNGEMKQPVSSISSISSISSFPAPKARAKLIDAVLNRPEYVDYWTLKWGDLLRNNSDRVQPKGMWSFYNWLRAAFRDNRPVDQFTRELITAQGSAYTTGPANYFRVASNPADLAETTSQVFLGIRLACAKCHHHPFEKWSQDDYWQMAAFFARVGLKGSQEFGIFGGEQVVRVNQTGEVSNPRTGKRMLPTPLDGQPVDDPIDRRRALANWLVSPANPHFARNIANRYWGYLMGRGIVEPVDDMRVTNPPSNPELLDALAKDFVEHKFDLKHLLRTIMTSETYQLSSNPTPENKQDEVFYTKYAVKRMGAEELLDAVNFATGTAEKFPNLPAGMRAVQLPDPNVPHYFLDTFGRPPRVITCECERTAEPNMAQALHLMNSDFVQNKIASPQGRVAKLLEAKKSDEEIITELYLVTFSRLPSAEDMARAQGTVTGAPSKKEGFEDLLWALLNSREFLFKH
jgi:uncharacterized protein DUF1553/uncharacterized protein DUF1549